MKLTFCGAAKRVTGSCYYLETPTKKIVIDCGMVQGSRVSEQDNFEPFPFNAAEVDVVLITHAHLDHTGRIPKLVREGFRGKIIATGATVKLAQLIMEDSVHIISNEAEHHGHDPIYTEADVATVSSLYETVEYHSIKQLDEHVSIQFFDAGHILGSSMIKITVDDESIVFSGDIGNPPAPLLQPTETITSADYVVMESTYGGRVHEDADTRIRLLQSAIYETVTMNGVLLIPAFALERTQELLYILNELINNKDIPPVSVFLDSPLAIKATKVFLEYRKLFNHETQQSMDDDGDIFGFPGLHMTVTTDQSKSINDYPAPKIIIAGSGMAQGGRIVHHIERYIGFFANQYLIVGYQVQGSLGRRLLDGAKRVRVFGKDIEVKAKVRAIGAYSAHADQPKLTEWLGHFDKQRLRRVFITHGEEDQATALQQHLHDTLSVDAYVPSMNETVALEHVDTQRQPVTINVH